MTNLAIVTSVDRRSAIARATLQMAVALAEIATVTIYAERTSHALHCPLPMRLINNKELRRHEHVICALGDSPFHVESFAVARRRPCVIILHDVLLAHLVAASLPTSDLQHEFVRWYGAPQASIAMRGAYSPQPFWDGPQAMDAPLFDPAVEHATGVIVHSQFACNLVAPRTIAPVRVVPLSYEADWFVEASTSPSRSPNAIGATEDSGSVLFTMGHANKNKSHELVIEALALLRDPAVRYVIAGEISDGRRAQLSDLAATLGVSDQVDLLGRVGAGQAADLLRTATICVNLRRPAMEGGSASLIEQMAAGQCVLVFDHGCYADAPDDAVRKLPPTSTPQTVAQSIRELLDDTQQRLDVGSRAKAHAASRHSAAAYASHVLDFLGDVGASLPANDLIRNVAGVGRSWGMSRESVLARRWAHAITAMGSLE